MDAMIDRDVDTADREIVITRLIAAPPELVFEAWTDPAHLAAWWGPDGFTTTTSAFDMRPGGVWRFVMHGPDGRNYENRITYEEVVRPERLVYRHGGGEDVEPLRFTTTVTFVPEDGKTRVTLRAVFPTAAERDRVVKEHGAIEGGKQTLAHLDQYVSERREDDFVVTRVFDAPRGLVWKAWTEPERLAAWWGPKGCKLRVVKVDLRPGGVFHYAMAYKPGHDLWGRFVYRDVAPPERLVYVSSFSDENVGLTRAPFKDTFPLEILNTLTLGEANGKTLLTLRGQPLHATAEERALFKDMFPSMQQGFGGTFDQLDAYLASQS
jgi:uncharacterized protein YndB with AHSA1/START domain